MPREEFCRALHALDEINTSLNGDLNGRRYILFGRIAPSVPAEHVRLSDHASRKRRTSVGEF